MMDRSTDHAERGLRKLISEHRADWKKGWLRAYLNRIQEYEDALWEIIELRKLDNAQGVQLDVLGRLVGRGRNGLNDTHYLLAIKTQIRINRSQGLTKDMTDVLRLSLPDDAPREYWEQAIATIRIDLGPGDYDVGTVVRNLSATKSGGVRLWIVIWNVSGSGDEDFIWSDEYAATPDDDVHGWGSVYDLSLGGRWVHLFEAMS